MAYKVILKKRFNNKLTKLLEYLEKEWGQKAAIDFLSKLDKRIEVLKQQPFVGKSSEKKPEVRAISITKRNRLYYKFSNNAIIILNLFDTRKNSNTIRLSRIVLSIKLSSQQILNPSTIYRQRNSRNKTCSFAC